MSRSLIFSGPFPPLFMTKQGRWNTLLAILLLPHVVPASLPHRECEQQLLPPTLPGDTHRAGKVCASVCLRLRGGISAGRGRRHSIYSMPRAKSMKQVCFPPLPIISVSFLTLALHQEPYAQHYLLERNRESRAR